MSSPAEHALEETQGTLFPLDVIRIETVASRNPIHNLSKRSGIQIAIRQTDETGKVAFQWEVSYASRYGHPGPLAYKVDTLVINRRIEEAGKPTPKIIQIGSLRDICAQLGLTEGKGTQDIKKALLQNAGAFVVAKLDYRGADGADRSFEFADNRYGVVLTGKKLPDGTKASAVYLVLHDFYRELLDRAPVRPLDYDYLKQLSPAAQRWYELVSYQVFAALRHKLPCARYRYSDLCTFGPLSRTYEWDQVRPQMYRIHLPHLQSRYLDSIEHEATTDSEGRPDWWFYYTPGRKAHAEYAAFTGKRPLRPRPERRPAPAPRRGAQQALPLPSVSPAPAEPREPAPGMPPAPTAGSPAPTAGSPAAPAAAPAAAPGADPELVQRLIENEVNRSDALRLAGEKPEECRRQLRYLPHVPEFRSSRGAYLRAAIEGGYGPPKSYTEQTRKEETRRRQAEETTRKQARQSHEKAYHGAYLRWLAERIGELESAAPEVITAFQAGDAAERARLTRLFPQRSSLLETTLQDYDREESRIERLRKFLAKHHPEQRLPEFWEWDATQNPARLAPDRPEEQ
jgi:hypothetical protein